MMDPIAGKRSGAISAKRVETAVRYVQDLHHAVDQREADGDDEQP